ncbi:MAG: methyltransferase domain-containing protein [Casimicrobiaceae bacterium]
MGLHLNLGCGRSPLPGWVNVDMTAMPGVDVVANLDTCRTVPLPFADNSASQMRMSHVLEHIADTLGLMQELHRVAEPGAICTIRAPYGSSDDADEDPTHRHRFFVNSFSFFGQPAFWRADYGYRGDWIMEEATLIVRKNENEGLTADAIVRKVQQLRNVVTEIVVVLKAVKPIRPPDRALQPNPVVQLQLV